MSKPLPSYDDLRARTDAPEGSSWGVFGPYDEIGTINLLTTERIVRAASLVRTGKSFSLDYAIDAFSPPPWASRRAPRHTIFAMHERIRDDFVDSFYLQGSSQIDGLRHVSHEPHGFYGGVRADEISTGSKALGIQHWADRGIVGRGVLLDVERHLAAKGKPINHAVGGSFGVDLLEEVAAAAGIKFEAGDILLLHTGWCRYYFEDLTQDDRDSMAGRGQPCCGLEQSREVLEWLWDNHFSVVASDTTSLEVRPTLTTSPFQTSFYGGMMHQDLIALLGLCLGELWRLEDLAADCAQDRDFEFMVVAKPLNIVGGVGSPPNALALK